MSENDVFRLENFRETSGIYVFADLRSFTKWSRSHQTEVKKLTKLLYTSAIQFFGDRKEAAYSRRVVKFVGDGFFAVNEYDDESDPSFQSTLLRTANDILSFIPAFYLLVGKSNLHDRSDIKVSFGVSYGSSFRFHIPGQPLDFIGDKVNLASRLCGAAGVSEVLLEYDLKSHLQATHLGQDSRLEFADRTEDLKSFGDTVVCGIRDTKAFLYEYTDLRHVSALIDTIKRRTKEGAEPERKVATGGT